MANYYSQISEIDSRMFVVKITVVSKVDRVPLLPKILDMTVLEVRMSRELRTSSRIVTGDRE